MEFQHSLVVTFLSHVDRDQFISSRYSVQPSCFKFSCHCVSFYTDVIYILKSFLNHVLSTFLFIISLFLFSIKVVTKRHCSILVVDQYILIMSKYSTEWSFNSRFIVSTVYIGAHAVGLWFSVHTVIVPQPWISSLTSKCFGEMAMIVFVNISVPAPVAIRMSKLYSSNGRPVNNLRVPSLKHALEPRACSVALFCL